MVSNAVVSVLKQPRDGDALMVWVFINNPCCLGAVCMYSPARLLEDPEPRGKKHSQSGGGRRNCDGKGAQGAGS